MIKNKIKMMLIILLFAFLFAGCTQQAAITTTELGVKDTKESATRSSGSAKEFFVEAFQFGYEPSEIRVKQGDSVTIHLKTRDTGHSLTIEDLGISVKALPDSPGTQTFVANKKGQFEWSCRIPCGAGHSDMHGTLVVE